MATYDVGTHAFSFNGAQKYFTVFAPGSLTSQENFTGTLYNLKDGPYLKYAYDSTTGSGSLTVDLITPGNYSEMATYLTPTGDTFNSIYLDFSKPAVPLIRIGGVGTIDILDTDPVGIEYGYYPLFQFTRTLNTVTTYYQVEALRIFPGTLSGLTESYTSDFGDATLDKYAVIDAYGLNKSLIVLQLLYREITPKAFIDGVEIPFSKLI